MVGGLIFLSVSKGTNRLAAQRGGASRRTTREAVAGPMISFAGRWNTGGAVLCQRQRVTRLARRPRPLRRPSVASAALPLDAVENVLPILQMQDGALEFFE